MLKVLADECIHTDLIQALSKANIDVEAVADGAMRGKSDDVIFKYACDQDRVLFTFDRGFGDIFRFDISRSKGVVITLVHQIRKEELLSTVVSFFQLMKERDLSGKLVIIGKSNIRILDR